MRIIALSFAIAALSVAGFASTPDLTSCNVWQPACTSNYTNSSRPSSYIINRAIIHKTQGGTAAGAASWFANCAAGASAHFTFDKVNGRCYQSVREADVAWQAGNWSTNCNSVGIEHSGWVANNDTAAVCYQKSAVEAHSLCVYYSASWDRSHIIGHNQVPGATHTDPAQYWNWSYYMGRY